MFVSFMARISIHALRVEGDQIGVDVEKCDGDFYPRPPGGGRHCLTIISISKNEFLSTPSGWRATEAFAAGIAIGTISIHALRVEGDHADVVNWFVDMRFLSTPSGWRATSIIG